MSARREVEPLPTGRCNHDLLRISPSPKVLNRGPQGPILVLTSRKALLQASTSLHLSLYTCSK